MNQKTLTLEQSICAARIFLNTFGFILDNTSEINELSKIRIYNKTMNSVGELYFNNGQVIISTNYDNCLLKASYDIPIIWGSNDKRSTIQTYQWGNNISFQIQNGKNINIKGKFLIDNFVDMDYGISCHCKPIINYQIANKENIFLTILNHGNIFGMEITSHENHETIKINPYNELIGFFRHNIIIKNKENSSERKGYSYRKSASISSFGTQGEFKNTLHVFLEEEDDNKTLSHVNDFVPKLENANSQESIIQKSKLMQKLDPAMFKRIAELRDIILINDVSLLDNLISVCYDSFTDEELHALLGIKRKTMKYQNGANNLVDSYYEINPNSCFFSTETQKKLLKK